MDKIWRRRFLKRLWYPRHEKIYILPTAQGLYHLLGSFLGILIALSYSNPLAIFFMFLWLSILLITAVLTQQSLAKTRFLDWLTDWRWNENSSPEFGGNFKSEMWDMAIKFEVSEKFISLKKSGQIEPGVHAIHTVRLSSNSPIGMFQSWCYLHTKKEIVVIAGPKDYGLKIPHLGKLNTEESKSSSNYFFESSTPGFPIQLDSLQIGARIHWRRMAASDQLIGIHPEIFLSERPILVFSEIDKLSLRESVRQILYWIQQYPGRWTAVKMPNGELWSTNAQLPTRLTFHISSLTGNFRGTQ